MITLTFSAPGLPDLTTAPIPFTPRPTQPGLLKKWWKAFLALVGG